MPQIVSGIRNAGNKVGTEMRGKANRRRLLKKREKEVHVHQFQNIIIVEQCPIIAVVPNHCCA